MAKGVSRGRRREVQWRRPFQPCGIGVTMRTIRVDPRVCNVRSYDSAAKAISAEMNTSRAARAALDSVRVADQYVKCYVISDQATSMALSNGLVLEIAVRAKQVEWRILEADALAVPVVQQSYPSLRLTWPSGAETVLDPATLIETRIHCPLQQVFAGRCFVNVYFKGGGVLQFLPLWNCSDQMPLLNLSELEPVSL